MFKSPLFSLISLALGIHIFLCCIPWAAAQVLRDDAPVWVQGALQDTTATNTSVYNTGGTIAINNLVMNVPKNLLVQFPAAWADFQGFETLFIGNTINGVHRVGQVIIYEFLEGLSGGFIQSINYTDGSMQIEIGPGPSITSFSRFPMCIPRNSSDPLCPMTPFLPGDFITFSRFRRSRNEVICFSIVAQNVQITTTRDIIYVRMELALVGIYSPDPNSELADSHLIGFVSNPLATVTLYAMDIDPCTGITTDRLIAGVGLRGGRNRQNKFEYRSEILFGYTRDYRATVELNGVPRTHLTKNGLVAGTYVQPINVWIPAEQDVPGTAPVPFEFVQMDFLTKGVGRDANTGLVWGPLDPFPQSGVEAKAPDCRVSPLAPAVGVNGASIEKRSSREKHIPFGQRVGRVQAEEAKASAHSKGSTKPETFDVAPAEAAAIAAKKKQDDIVDDAADDVFRELQLEVAGEELVRRSVS
ncbi:hypothetical protein B0H63DRAFT_498279 [Podospora didyma]|uniref:Peptidase A1 domain-containing protein n=1 Tax=Podospora didyma TaxID=330526 RepID=A0AAE0MZJ6_9PEZI|nr:hypothetical protein B0H63DRAFT_498279 [Podospora didyma]